jgi:hypothetical protein
LLLIVEKAKGRRKGKGKPVSSSCAMCLPINRMGEIWYRFIEKPSKTRNLGTSAELIWIINAKLIEVSLQKVAAR